MDETYRRGVTRRARCRQRTISTPGLLQQRCGRRPARVRLGQPQGRVGIVVLGPYRLGVGEQIDTGQQGLVAPGAGPPSGRERHGQHEHHYQGYLQLRRVAVA